MTELRDGLSAMHIHEWRFVPITVSHHKWWLKIYKFGAEGYWFCFISPMRRKYSFRASREDGRVRVTNADVALASGETIACYLEGLCDTAKSRDAVIRLTPRHILRKLSMLLDAIE